MYIPNIFDRLEAYRELIKLIRYAMREPFDQEFKKLITNQLSQFLTLCREDHEKILNSRMQAEKTSIELQNKLKKIRERNG